MRRGAFGAPDERTGFMTDQLKKRKRKANLNRFVAFALAFVLLSLCLLSAVFTREIVTLTDSAGHNYNALTSRASAGIATQITQLSAGYDQLELEGAGPGYSVVWADGLLHRVDLKSGTVGDLLDVCGVEVSGEDFVEPAVDTPISGQMRVEVCRVGYREDYTRTEVAPEDVEAYKIKYYEENPTGNFRESNAGVYDVTYRHTLVNGDISESEILELCPVMTPRPAGSTEFLNSTPCSRVEGYDDIRMGPDGIPQGYTRVINGANTTAYSSSGGRGASGLGLYNGTAAVNPGNIPYGTRMYITSSDGSFIYGWTIATDTGIALMDGRATIDLYFETNGECLRFGRRALDVYIFD